MSNTIEGRCLCGEVSWEIAGPLVWMAHCHCSMCRKAHGTAYATFVTFDASALRWRSGLERVGRYESSPASYRAFCAGCGSKLPSIEPFAYAMAGSLEGELGVQPSCHMFAASKAPWHAITDALPQHATFPPDAGDAQAQPDRRRTEPAAGKIRGACLCGAAAYELDGPLEGGAIVCCHCSRCRRARSAAYAANLFVHVDGFRWLRGEDRVVAFKVPEAARFRQAFCTTCGSPMPLQAVGAPRVMIPTGTLEDDPGAREALHIFAGSKAGWDELSDELPRYDAYPASGFPPIAHRAATDR